MKKYFFAEPVRVGARPMLVHVSRYECSLNATSIKVQPQGADSGVSEDEFLLLIAVFINLSHFGNLFGETRYCKDDFNDVICLKI